MPVPATTGQLRTTIKDMQVGDYINCQYIGNPSDPLTAITRLGSSTSAEIPVTSGASTNGSFYFIKVDKGLLIADRVVHSSVSWDQINAKLGIEGKPVSFSANVGQGGWDGVKSIDGIIRSLGGGNSYASATGTSQTTNAGLGAWPVDNEWDKYIINFSTQLIQSGKTLDDVFHIASNVNTWCQDTILNGVMNVTHTGNRRMTRSNPSDNNGGIGNIETTRIATWLGFRPVFEFQEVTP